MRERLVEQRVAEEQLAMYESRLKRQLEEVERNGMAAVHMRKVQAEILTQAFPRCHTAFVYGDGYVCGGCKCG